MITKPVRMYLILLFAAVVGVAGYMMLKQQNDDYSSSEAQGGTTVKDVITTPTPSATATAKPTASATPGGTALNTTDEANSLDTLLSSVPSTDFDDSTLTSSSLGF